MKKKLLIIGAKGFIGRNLLAHFSSMLEYEVRGESQHEPYEAFDIVINCGAKIHNASFDELINSNITSPTAYLLKYFKLNNNVKYLHLGSSSEYGIHNSKLNEDFTICNPKTDYGVTKLIGTKSVLELSNILNCKANVIRPFSIYGKNDNSYRFLPLLMKALKDGSEVNLYPGAHDWTYIKDFCSLTEKIIQSDLKGVVLNCGTGESTSNLFFVKCLEEVTGKKINYTIKEVKYRDYDTDFWAADIEKSKKLLNWSPKFDLNKGLTDVFTE